MKFLTQQKNNIFRKKGFTLIEMLVAVFIFSVALAGLMTVSSRGLRAARIAQDRVVADYLALEGIEAVRNIRDSAFLLNAGTNTWLSVFSQDGCFDAIQNNANDRCGLELSGNIALYPCSSGDCDLYYNPDSALYGQFMSGPSGALFTRTNYDRRIHLQQTSNPDEIIVTVDVVWPNGSVQYVENLFLWF